MPGPRVLMMTLSAMKLSSPPRDDSRRAPIEQMNFERLPPLNQLDEVPDGIQGIPRAIDGNQCPAHCRPPSSQSEVATIHWVAEEIFGRPAGQFDLPFLAKVLRQRLKRRPHGRGNPVLTACAVRLLPFGG